MDPKTEEHRLSEQFRDMWRSFGEMTPEWSKMLTSSDAAKEFWEEVGKTNQGNIDSLKQLNQQVAASFKSIGERQMSLFETMMNETEAAAKEMRAEGAKAPEAATETFQKMLAGMREIAAIAEKANKDALAEIEQRGATLRAEIKEMIDKAKG